MRRFQMSIVLAGLIAAGTSASAEDRMMSITRETFACTSWAGWREYVQASLQSSGARMNRHCPIRIAAGSRVAVVDDDAGSGAAEVRLRGKTWYVDGDKLR